MAETAADWTCPRHGGRFTPPQHCHWCDPTTLIRARPLSTPDARWIGGWVSRRPYTRRHARLGPDVLERYARTSGWTVHVWRVPPRRRVPPPKSLTPPTLPLVLDARWVRPDATADWTAVEGYARLYQPRATLIREAPPARLIEAPWEWWSTRDLPPLSATSTPYVLTAPHPQGVDDPQCRGWLIPDWPTLWTHRAQWPSVLAGHAHTTLYGDRAHKLLDLHRGFALLQAWLGLDARLRGCDPQRRIHRRAVTSVETAAYLGSGTVCQDGVPLRFVLGQADFVLPRVRYAFSSPTGGGARSARGNPAQDSYRAAHLLCQPRWHVTRATGGT